MLNFRLFLEKSEEEKNIQETIKKIPKSHACLLKGYTFKFNRGNTLNNDDEHIGVIDPSTKTVTLAGSWNYSREFTFLHELGHKVWENILTPKLKEEWKKIIKELKNKNKDGLDQNNEELFCHAYSMYYCKNKPALYNYKQWKEFIGNLPK